jgi:RHS repeat-associated protein
VHVSGAPNDVVNYSYDKSGTFTTKDDYATAYNLHASRPHVVTSINKVGGGTLTFTYDENGNVKERGGDDITYNAFNKPTKIHNPVTGQNTEFTYGADLMRYRQITPTGSTIYYLDKLMEIEATASSVDYRHYLGDIGILTKTGDLNDPSPGVSYFFRDRLGGISMIGDETGILVEYRAYDAFGKPRNGNWTDKGTPTISSSVTDRGFTDHEHLDDWQLIHMNGRGYDYNLGRFLSIDPFIQDPGNSQSINAYAYIMNNPLSGTDPTGYCSTGTRIGGTGVGNCRIASGRPQMSSTDKIVKAAVNDDNGEITITAENEFGDRYKLSYTTSGGSEDIGGRQSTNETYQFNGPKSKFGETYGRVEVNFRSLAQAELQLGEEFADGAIQAIDSTQAADGDPNATKYIDAGIGDHYARRQLSKAFGYYEPSGGIRVILRSVNFVNQQLTAVRGTSRVTPPLRNSSFIPEGYMHPHATIDMSLAPSGSATNALGWPRNGPWFWRQIRTANPEFFSQANLARIASGRSPVVDPTWIKHFPSHSSFGGQRLIHHHMNQGRFAVPLPESIHRVWSTTLHPLL